MKALEPKYGRLTIIGEPFHKEQKSGKRILFINAQCDCGERVSCRIGHLRSGNITSCGCLRRELMGQRNIAAAAKLKSFYGHLTVIGEPYLAETVIGGNKFRESKVMARCVCGSVKEN